MSIELNITFSDEELIKIAESYTDYLRGYSEEAIEKSGVDLTNLSKVIAASSDLHGPLYNAVETFKTAVLKDPYDFLIDHGEPRAYSLALMKIEDTEIDILNESEEQTDQDKIDAAILLLRKNGYVTKAKDEA